MIKKKKTNILKKIILTLTACFIAVFSVFSLFDMPKEIKKVSADEISTRSAVGQGDIVYNSGRVFVPAGLTQRVPSDTFNNSNIKVINYVMDFTFIYSLSTNLATLNVKLFGPSLVESINYSPPTISIYPTSTYATYSGQDISISYGSIFNTSYSFSITFNALYSLSYKNCVYIQSGIESSSDSNYQWLFFGISYSYNGEYPFSFDKLTTYLDPFGNNVGLGDQASVLGQVVREYSVLQGNTSNLTFYSSGPRLMSFSNLSDYTQISYLRPNYESSGGGSSDPNAYQNGYDNGYSRGYIDGESSAQDSFFDRGYNEGYDSGKADGYLEGEQAGISQGNTSGYLRGKNDGYREGKEAALNDSDKYSFTSLITSVIDVPINSFRSMFNFEVLGVDLSGFFLGLLTCCIVITIVKMII